MFQLSSFYCCFSLLSSSPYMCMALSNQMRQQEFVRHILGMGCQFHIIKYGSLGL